MPRIHDLRTTVDDTIKGALRLMQQLTKERTDEEVSAAAMLPPQECPFYLHAALKLSSQHVAPKENGSRGNTLNIVLNAPAPSVGAWNDQVQQYKLEESKRRDAFPSIDVTAVPAEAKAK